MKTLDQLKKEFDYDGIDRLRQMRKELSLIRDKIMSFQSEISILQDQNENLFRYCIDNCKEIYIPKLGESLSILNNEKIKIINYQNILRTISSSLQDLS